MRIAIIQFPGSNCERETMLAVKRAHMEPVEFLWNQPHAELADFAGYIIVGGFSYEDRSRSGVIAALDPVMQVIAEQSEDGKPVLGICNGAQILVETGLVPGLENNQVAMALTENRRLRNGQVLGTGYYNAWVHMRLADEFQYNAFTRHLSPREVMRVPVAHGEGRFIIPPALLMEMEMQGQAVFRYCDAAGKIIDEFPVNPNGSVLNIAAVSNKAGNVMAMMPHPERTPNGDAIFHSMRDHIEKGYKEKVAPLNYQSAPLRIEPYKTTAHEIIVDMIITDNQALSVENALQRAGIPAKITRHVHWEIVCDPDAYEKILQSGVLFNDRKELRLQGAEIKTKQSVQKSFLVRAKEDVLGQDKKQMLENHFGVTGIQSIRHGILWNVAAAKANAEVTDDVINSTILFNANAHDCYYY